MIDANLVGHAAPNHIKVCSRHGIFERVGTTYSIFWREWLISVVGSGGTSDILRLMLGLPRIHPVPPYAMH